MEGEGFHYRVGEISLSLMSSAVVTFNCNKLKQSTEEIRSVINEPLAASTPDFIVLSLQEVAPIMDAAFGWMQTWLEPFKQAVPPNFTFVAEEICGTIVLLIFKSSNAPSIESVWSKTSSFGLFWSSTKGAACISLKLRNGNLTFVGAHLCANEGCKELRNRDFATFAAAFDLIEQDGQVIVAGDLNYRSRNGSLGSEELSKEMQSGRVALGFKEAPIAFKPTYKYEHMTSNFKKNRVPSWCDRVLYRELEGVEVVVYKSYLTPVNSDHKPVYFVVKSPLEARPIADYLHVEGSTERAKIKSQQPLFSFYTPAANFVVGSACYLVLTNTGRVILLILLPIIFFVYRSFFQ